MKTNRKWLTALCFGAAALAALAGGCAQATTPPGSVEYPATGTLTVRLGLEGAPAARSADGARTVFPDFAGVTGYKLSFAPTSGGQAHDPVDVGSTGTTSPVTLVAGTYTVTAAAYTAAGGATPVAEGSTTVEITNGGSATASITMGPKAGGANGTFSYVVAFPADADTADLAIAPKSGGACTTVDLKTLSPTPGTGTTALAPGYYDVTVSVTKDGKAAGDAEVVHVYSGLTSSWAVEYEDNRFAPELEAGSVSITFGQEEPISLAGFTGELAIQKGGESVALTVEGYTEVVWKVDGAEKGTGPSFELDPEDDDYDVRTHSLTVAGTKGGIPYALNLSFVVKAAGSAPAGPVNAAGLAAALAAIPVDKGNSAGDPYTVALDDTVDVTSDAWGTTIKSALDAAAKYITLDLSRCGAGSGETKTITGSTSPSGNNFNVIKDNTHIVGIILPNVLTQVGSNALRSMASLIEVIIPNSVTEISNNAFKDCSAITSVIIPSNISSIGAGAFMSTALTRVTFEKVNTTISNANAFPSGSSLMSAYQTGGAGTYILTGETWSKQ
jgi:hypothetical protein